MPGGFDPAEELLNAGPSPPRRSADGPACQRSVLPVLHPAGRLNRDRAFDEETDLKNPGGRATILAAGIRFMPWLVVRLRWMHDEHRTCARNRRTISSELGKRPPERPRRTVMLTQDDHAGGTVKKLDRRRGRGRRSGSVLLYAERRETGKRRRRPRHDRNQREQHPTWDNPDAACHRARTGAFARPRDMTCSAAHRTLRRDTGYPRGASGGGQSGGGNAIPVVNRALTGQ